MREKDKMKAGLPYHAANPLLVYERDRAAKILRRYNKKPYHEYQMRNRLLRKLLHTEGNFWIKPPFYCDYGYHIHLGKNVLLNTGCVLLDVCEIHIGDHTLIGPGTHIYTACHAIASQERLHDVEYGKPVTIGKNVWIGGRSVILPGVIIGDHAVIGAGSVVCKDIPPHCMAVGNPARIIKQIK